MNKKYRVIFLLVNLSNLYGMSNLIEVVENSTFSFRRGKQIEKYPTTHAFIGSKGSDRVLINSDEDGVLISTFYEELGAVNVNTTFFYSHKKSLAAIGGTNQDDFQTIFLLSQAFEDFKRHAFWLEEINRIKQLEISQQLSDLTLNEKQDDNVIQTFVIEEGPEKGKKITLLNPHGKSTPKKNNDDNVVQTLVIEEGPDKGKKINLLKPRTFNADLFKPIKKKT